jgi:S-adenosylmethionine/arginine decarboxylase-like enzyme
MSWGKHAIIDAGGCNDNVTNKKKILEFNKNLIDAIGMKAHGKPILEYFDHLEPEKNGWTLIQLITTSSITAHFVDDGNRMFLDIFSCKDFDIAIVKEVINGFFEPIDISFMVIDRDA